MLNLHFDGYVTVFQNIVLIASAVGYLYLFKSMRDVYRSVFDKYKKARLESIELQQRIAKIWLMIYEDENATVKELVTKILNSDLEESKQKEKYNVRS